jgi:hypothetical protein
MIELVATEDLYKRKITGNVERLTSTDQVLLTEVLRDMEVKLEEVSRKTVILDAKTEQLAKKVKLELPVLFSKTGSLDTIIGKRVKNENSEFLAPTIWSSIALLTT